MIFDLVALASFSVIVPLTAGMALYKRLPVPGRLITWLLASWFLAETVSYVLRIQGISNWNVYVALSVAQILIIIRFYEQIIVTIRFRKIVAWLGWAGLAILITEYAYTKGPANTITSLYESIIYVGMGLMYFYEKVLLSEEKDYTNLVASIMILFTGSGVYLSTWAFMQYDEHLFRLFGDTHAFLLIGCYILFTLGLWRLQL